MTRLNEDNSSMTLYTDLEEKVVLLTGGANGIGRATVQALHAQGAVVCFCDLDEGAGGELAKSLGRRAVFSKVNLRNENAIKRWVERSGTRFGRIDVLVNNAAIDPRIPLRECTARQWDELLSNNLRAAFLTSRECVRFFPESGGSIVNFGSVTFHEGPPEMSAYVASKGGIIGLTRSLARELGPRFVRVNAILPGWIMTERQLKMYVTPAVKKRIRKGQCIPELLQPEEIARVVLFLASDASRAVTGQSLLADRGWYFD